MQYNYQNKFCKTKRKSRFFLMSHHHADSINQEISPPGGSVTNRVTPFTLVERPGVAGAVLLTACNYLINLVPILKQKF